MKKFIKQNFYSIGITIITVVLLYVNISNLQIIKSQETRINNLKEYVNHLYEINDITNDYANRLKEKNDFVDVRNNNDLKFEMDLHR
jgi:hypothetical protein